MLTAGGALGHSLGELRPPAPRRLHPPAVDPEGERRVSLDESVTVDCHSSITKLRSDGPVGRHAPAGAPERTPPSRPPGRAGDPPQYWGESRSWTHVQGGVGLLPARTRQLTR